MPEVGIHEIAVNIMKERLEAGKLLIHQRYKGVQPFRKPPTPDREALYKYMSLSERDKVFGRHSFGDVFNEYENKMIKLQDKYGR